MRGMTIAFPVFGRRFRGVLRLADGAGRESEGEMGEVDACGDDRLAAPAIHSGLRAGLLVVFRCQATLPWIGFAFLLANRMGGSKRTGTMSACCSMVRAPGD